MTAQRIIVVGGPRRGKSTYARSLELPRFCTDPASRAPEVEDGVTYLPEEFAPAERWSDGSQYIADHWFSMPGPWVIEGIATVRALRKWLAVNTGTPCDQVVDFTSAPPLVAVKPGHEAMARSVAVIWAGIADKVSGIVVAGGRPEDPFRHTAHT